MTLENEASVNSVCTSDPRVRVVAVSWKCLRRPPGRWSPAGSLDVLTWPAPCPPGHANTAASLRRNRLDRSFLDGFEDLLDDLRVERRAAMERNHDPSPTLFVDSMTALGPQPNETRPQQHCLRLRGGSGARHFRHELRRRW